MRKTVGILTSLKIESSDEPYSHYYKICSFYIDRIKERNTNIVGIFDANNLDLYDGFILPGGVKITEDHYKIIDYAIKNNKPCLGICAGMQAMILYDYLSHKINKDNFMGVSHKIAAPSRY